jgi:hypothetical protein
MPFRVRNLNVPPSVDELARGLEILRDRTDCGRLNPDGGD